MTIRLDISEIIYDVADRSHAECLAAYPDPEERYRFEAGTDRRDAVMRCLETAAAALDVALEEFTSGPHSTLGADAPLPSASGSLVYVFPQQERRVGTLAGAAAGLMHSFLVGRTLSLFDASLGREDAAKSLAAQSAADLEGLLTGLRTKTRPVRAKPYMR